jgi:two-component system nitrate/nitrite sensor histidine kinase NarX
MKTNSIQVRLGLLLTAFLLLVIISVGATFWGLNAQKKDALVINLAGRQRMLIQKMTRLTREMENESTTAQVNELMDSANIFEETLSALYRGGLAPYQPGQYVEIPSTSNPQILNQIEEVRQTWKTFNKSIQSVAERSPENPEFRSALENISTNSVNILEQADLVVHLYEEESTKKLLRLRWIQVGFGISAFGLLIIGGILTRETVLKPLLSLSQSANRIGSGDFNTPIRLDQPDEINELAGALDHMRLQLKDSQHELLSWAETLEKRVTKRTSELNALYEVSRDISSRLEIDHVLESVTEKARHLLDSEVATLCLLTNEGKTLQIQAHSGPSEAVVGELSSAQKGFGEQVLTAKNSLSCGSEQCKGHCSILSNPFRTSHLAASLRVGDQVIGALCVGSSTTQLFSQDDAHLLTKLANSAAIALENARLYEQAERVATLEERQRIAADIHDGLGQTLSYLGLKLDRVREFIELDDRETAIDHLEKIRDGLDQVTADVRTNIADLMDKSTPRKSLQDRLENLVSDLSNKNNIDTMWDDELEKPLYLPRDRAEQVWRVANEALLNAYYHSHANKIQVLLERIEGDYRLSVIDNGVGFDPSNPNTDGENHFGIQIMQARAARLGGHITFKSSSGKGTQVSLVWPIIKESNQHTADAEFDGKLQVTP